MQTPKESNHEIKTLRFNSLVSALIYAEKWVEIPYQKFWVFHSFMNVVFFWKISVKTVCYEILIESV